MEIYPPLGQIGPRLISAWGIRTKTAHVALEGSANLPERGPAIIVARHYHHLLDGAVLVSCLKRPVHIVVALDWTADARQRTWMERACRAAQYPVVLRRPSLATSGAYRPDDLLRYTRKALRDTTRLLRAGRVIVVFAEGYPNIDPTGSMKPGFDDWLPFEAGFLRMLAMAERDGTTRVALVPVGFHYEPGARWSITARMGAPLGRDARQIGMIETAVRRLSVADRSLPQSAV